MIDKKTFIELIRQKMEYAEFVLPIAGDALTEGFKRGDARIVTAFSAENEPVFEVRYLFGGDEPTYFILKLISKTEDGKYEIIVFDFSDTITGEPAPIETQIETISTSVCDGYDGADVILNWLGD